VLLGGVKNSLKSLNLANVYPNKKNSNKNNKEQQSKNEILYELVGKNVT
jgi:hypothetical protein